MKKIILFAIVALFTVNVWGQQTYYDVTSGDGNGLRFWRSDNYKIHMGDADEYHYGPVISYSIKMNMTNTVGRGWTWGPVGLTPIAALSTTGDMQIAGKFVSAGNVGIGIINPNAKLDVLSRDSHLGRFYFFDDESNPRLDIWGSANKINIRTTFTTGGADLSFGTTAANDALIIKQDGRIGIGIEKPSAKLDVLSRDSHLGRFYFIDDNSNPELNIWGSANKINIRTTFTTGGADLSFGTTAANDALIIKQDGRIGIGVTNPTYKLTVDGTIGAREVKVTSEVWSDFVFEPDYNLMNLKDLETFIKINKHLPEIPTTAEVEKDGISVGEMNAKLLQKIEELTLYVIELKKENEEQNNINTQLINDINDLKKRISK